MADAVVVVVGADQGEESGQGGKAMDSGRGKCFGTPVGVHHWKILEG